MGLLKNEGRNPIEIAREICPSNFSPEALKRRYNREKKRNFQKKSKQDFLVILKEMQISCIIESFAIHRDPLNNQQVIDIARTFEDLLSDWEGFPWLKGFLYRNQEVLRRMSGVPTISENRVSIQTLSELSQWGQKIQKVP